ncbi:anti-anti-sigma factor [Mycobacterium sp. ITM-2017-0098]|nr:anti-anti-sigma factor [Mycobacterium sp. ITM-2017-0098]
MATALEAGARQGPEALIVDLSNVQFLASAGMSVLITAAQDLSSSMRFGVVADGPSTSRPLSLTRVDTLVAVYPSLDQALCD